jgi:BirA family biotin operon repressor/biotin-[acetyl-CoA-carboxylase] ligase
LLSVQRKIQTMDRLDRLKIRVPGLEVRVIERCTSTNAVLLSEKSDHPVLLAAEEQTAGRGQRGRRWHSARGAGATFSIRRRMRCAPQLLAGLSLAIGVAAARALRALGAGEVTLKWPNDLLAGGKHAGAKLGGIMIETRVQGAQISAVIGIGINCRPVRALGARLRRSVAALGELMQPAPERNAVIAAVAREVLAALEAYERSGLPAFSEDWRALHAHEGRRLRVRLADGRTVSGIAAGIAPSGALRLRTRAGTRDITSGRILEFASRLRAAKPSLKAAA